MSIEEVGDLTDWQINNVFFRPKEGEKAAVKPAASFSEAMAIAAAEAGTTMPEVIFDGPISV